jgi:hypothetical protein
MFFSRIILSFLAAIVCLPFFIQAEQKADLLQAIDKKIEELKEEMHKEQLIEMKEEVDAQGLMIADWPAYAEKVVKIRKIDEKELQLQKKIDELEERKKKLMQDHSSKNTNSN